MPTPAVHLALASKMLRQNDLPVALRGLLTAHSGAFLLGHTAPDVRAISGQRREESHFQAVRRQSRPPACQALLERHPELGRVDELAPPRATFVAGYLAHLVLDEIWLREVFHRFLAQEWENSQEPLLLHNVLRTWIDRRAQERLDNDLADELLNVEPHDWLPFVDDQHLRQWRDWLTNQLRGPGKMETAEVLARRMGIESQEIEDVINSPADMERRIFRHVSRGELEALMEKGYDRSLELVAWYLSPASSGRQTCPTSLSNDETRPAKHRRLG